MDGINVVPRSPKKLKAWIRKAARASIPVICLIDGGPDKENLVTVSVDTTASGAMVADLMGRLLRNEGKVPITKCMELTSMFFRILAHLRM